PAVAQTPSPGSASSASPLSFTVSESGAPAAAREPSAAPLSHAGPSGRLTPRWSCTTPRQSNGVPTGTVSSAGLLLKGSFVGVGPPLAKSGPSSAGPPCWSPTNVKPHVESEARLNPTDETGLGAAHARPSGWSTIVP